jgi:hypothetical protein
MKHSTLPVPFNDAARSARAPRRRLWRIVLGVAAVLALIAIGCLAGWDLPDARSLIRGGR